MSKLTTENHLERDARLNGWTVNGIGPNSHPTDTWVEMILDIRIDVEIPAYLQEMFERAQACMVYGCYHYPLFTLGHEEMYRFGESAFREAIKETGASKTVNRKSYADLQNWAHTKNLIDSVEAERWSLSRQLRNFVSHKNKKLLLGPNDALMQLDMTKELTEALFINCRSRTSNNKYQSAE